LAALLSVLVWVLALALLVALLVRLALRALLFLHLLLLGQEQPRAWGQALQRVLGKPRLAHLTRY
jgi:hypothetical protein